MMPPTALQARNSLPVLDAEGILAQLPNPVLLLDADGRISYVNQAAEHFFAAGAPHLRQCRLAEILPYDSPLLALVALVVREGMTMSEHGVELGTPRNGAHLANISVSPLPESSGAVLIVLQEAGIASKMDRQFNHRGAARMVTGMAAVLAHEIKNPLSGIRGAAQLLEPTVGPEDQTLTQLICEEADRICALVDRMETFSDKPVERQPVNIHRVLERVRKIAETGFARHVVIEERYDPSLPPVHGNFDQLVQAFLNLVKNAAVAVPEEGGQILLSTAFRHGVRLAIPGSNSRMKLPLEVAVSDNGSGVPEDLMPHLFDPFITTKRTGTGLGLALVAKIVGDHGGIVECDTGDRRTTFRVMLPLFESGSGEEDEG